MALRTARRRSLFLLAVVLLGGWACAGEGKDSPAAAKPPAPASDLETVAVVADQAPVKAGDQVVATVEKGRMFGVLARRGDEVEVQVCVGTQILRGTLAISQVKFLTDADIDLAAEWLKMSKDLDPKVDVAAYRAKLDALIDCVVAAAAVGKTPREKARLIGVQLFEREGFLPDTGKQGADQLLDLRQGNCFSLSLLYVFIGKRLGVPFYLVPAPEHLFIRFDGDSERFSIETTSGGTLHASDDYLRESLGAHRFDQAGGIHLSSLPTPRGVGLLLKRWGVELGELGRPAEACEKHSKAVEINPRDAVAYSNWGTALGDMGQHAEACEKHARAVEIAPRLAAAYSNWGVALGDMGKHTEGCEKYAKAVAINPRYAAAYGNWGNALARMGKHAEACEKYAKVVEFSPRDAVAYYNWGCDLRDMGKPAEACEKLAKAVEINPRFAKAYRNWGMQLGKMGKQAEACEKYAKAAEINPQDAETYYNWGTGLGKMGLPADACEKYAKAAEIDPRNALAYFNWGIALGKMSKRAEAIEKLDKAVALDLSLEGRVEDLRRELLGGK